MTNRAFFVKFTGGNADQEAVNLKALLANNFPAENYTVSEVPPAALDEVEAAIEAETAEGDENQDAGAEAAKEAA